MSTRIIVGFDGGPAARLALDWAAHEAVARGCGLDIVSCYRIPASGDMYTAGVPTSAYADIRESMSEVAQNAADITRAAHTNLDVAVRICAGAAADQLVADGAGVAELVVVGASGHRRAPAFWLGSTPRAVVRRAKCPVVVVRGASSAGRPDRIVVGVDDSVDASAALRWAAAEADLHGVTLLVVHAWDHPYDSPDRAVSQARDLTRIDAARVLDCAVQLARDTCGGDVDHELIEASPRSAILSLVRDGDVLVLGSRGRGAWRSGLFGSTVNSVLDEAEVPVVVIPPHERI